MNIVDGFDRFHFDNDTFFDQKISNKIANHNVLISNFDPVLLHSSKADLLKFYSQRILINLLKKSGAKDIAYLMDTTDNFFGNLIQP